jgi:chloramphenicol 3-O phosphotransferase
MPTQGRVIFLNGTSSSGKTSIATALLEILDPPHFHMSVDMFNRMRSQRRTLDLDRASVSALLRLTCLGFHRAVAGMASAGNPVILDHVLSERWRLLDCLQVLDGHDVVLVGVHCSLAEVERRERLRGHRVLGLAAEQYRRVHSHAMYDVEVDTEANSPLECAEQIRDYVAKSPDPPPRRVFDDLRQLLTATRELPFSVEQG